MSLDPPEAEGSWRLRPRREWTLRWLRSLDGVPIGIGTSLGMTYWQGADGRLGFAGAQVC